MLLGINLPRICYFYFSMGLLSCFRSTVLRKCSKGSSGMSRFLYTNNFQRNLISSGGNESYYGYFNRRSYTSLYMGTGTVGGITSARIRVPNVGCEGFMCSSHLSITQRNSRLIHSTSKIVPNSEIQNITTEMVKTPEVSRFVFFTTICTIIFVLYTINWCIWFPKFFSHVKCCKKRKLYNYLSINLVIGKLENHKFRMKMTHFFFVVVTKCNRVECKMCVSMCVGWGFSWWVFLNFCLTLMKSKCCVGHF